MGRFKRFEYESTEETMDEKRARAMRSGYSNYYNRYFEGYVERKVPKKNGGEKIERIYVGDTWRHDMSDQRWVLLKVVYAVLFLVGFSFFAVSSLSSLPGNSVMPVQLTVALTTLAQWVLFYNLICYWSAKRSLTVWGFKETSPRVKTNALIVSILSFIVAMIQCIFCLVERSFMENAVFVFAYLTSGFAFFAISYIERDVVKYKITSYEGDLPEHEVMI